ncbi:thiol-disulfide oxidoreductase DCC family protein [Chenggangzhangella methanolivorans]|uniref:Thiol-disulfide oxidoreductase DCC family protein n=1 Tax=Chenggangzhangella methanolivorans TaxID=1437009 RepID=A0A9E6UG38_9HYPH|nr:thiol-disulfide oxidoreductase DCC family protein [Chenggangzhangella methanolivorans]QZN98352.1 thiol-disulfide oxidoreductase DCC family protein [Chenggangzhangella methanolivorans]
MDRWIPRPAPDLPEGLILFDGVCLFCSRWVRFVLARDEARRFSFATLQSPYGRAVAVRIGIAADDPETNVVILGGRALFKSDAAIGVLSGLPGHGWACALKLAPKPLRDFAYDRVAKNRYRMFGKSDACFMPSAADRARFLDEAAPPETKRL